MPIVQEAVYVPPWIMEGLMDGSLVRYGSVVRRGIGPHKGEIVKHLKSVERYQPENAYRAVARPSIKNSISKATKYVTGHPGKTTVLGLVAVVAGFAGHRLYKRYKKNHEFSEISAELTEKLNAYIRQLNSGRLDLSTIDELQVVIEGILQDEPNREMIVQIPILHLKEMIDLSEKYTENLIRLNNLDIAPAEVIPGDDETQLRNFLSQLETQKRIFSMA